MRLHRQALNHLRQLLSRRPNLIYRLLRLRLKAAKERRPLVFILLCERMGDILACEPISREIREAQPDALIVWLAGERYTEVVACFPAVDEVVAVTCIAELLRTERWMGGSRRVNLHLDGKECYLCGTPRVQRGTGIDTENYYNHGTLYQAFRKVAGWGAGVSRSPQLELPPALQLTVDRLSLPERFVAVHCRSDEAGRDWCPEGWQQLMNLADSLQLPMVEIGAGQASLPRARSLVGRLSILETAEVIRRAVLFVGIDSGPAHLANSVGTPGLILLGRYRRFGTYVPYDGFYGADGGGAELLQHWDQSPFLPIAWVLERFRVLVEDIGIGKRLAGPRPLRLPPGDLHTHPERSWRLKRTDGGWVERRSSGECDPSALVVVQVSREGLAIPALTAFGVAGAGTVCFRGRPLVWVLHDNVALERLTDALNALDQAAVENGWPEPCIATLDLALLVSGPVPAFAWQKRDGLWCRGDAVPASMSLNESERVATLRIERPKALPTPGAMVHPLPAGVQGNIDAARRDAESITANGWAVLTATWWRPADRLYVALNNGREVQVVSEITEWRDARHDVAAHLGCPWLQFSGWHVAQELTLTKGMEYTILAGDELLGSVHHLGTLERAT